MAHDGPPRPVHGNPASSASGPRRSVSQRATVVNGQRPPALPTGNAGATGSFSPVTRARGISIRTKVILPMALLTTLLVIVIGALFSLRAGSALEAQINKDGVGYVKAVRAMGELYATGLSEAALLQTLAAIERATPAADAAGQWRDLKGYYQINASSRFKAFDASRYASFDELQKHLQWIYVANGLETISAEPQVRDTILGLDWQNAKTSRVLTDGAVATYWPSDGTSLSARAISSHLHNSNARLRMNRLIRALVQYERAEATRSFERIIGPQSSRQQFAGLRYTPPDDAADYLNSYLSDDEQDARDDVTIAVGQIELKDLSESQSTEASNIAYAAGFGPEGDSYRLFTWTPTGSGESASVVLNDEVMSSDAAETRTFFILIGVAAVLIATIVAVLVGNGLTAPIRALAKDVALIAGGNFEHRPAIRSRDEVGSLAKLVGDMAQRLSAGRETWLENEARKHDIDMAGEIQDNLLPAYVPERQGYDIAAYYAPSKEVGGDYYDFFEIDDSHLALVCADVSGKGIPAGMVMMMTKALIASESSRNPEPAELLTNVNRILAKDIKRGMFVTVFYLLLDTRLRTIKVASAGHNPMLVFREDGGKVAKVNPGGIALGFDRDGKLFEKNLQQQVIQLQHGDRVLIYTDGVTEAVNRAGEEFGEERLMRFLKQHGSAGSQDFLGQLVDSVQTFAQSDLQNDDITILTFRVT